MSTAIIIHSAASADPIVLRSNTDWLQQKAETIRTKGRTMTATIIDIGIALIEVKEKLGHGQFGSWVSAECGFSTRSAQNYMRLADLAGKNEAVALLSPTAAYMIASKSFPPTLAAEVLERTRTGPVPSEEEVTKLLSEVRVQREREARRRRTAKIKGRQLSHAVERRKKDFERQQRKIVVQIDRAAEEILSLVGRKTSLLLIEKLRIRPLEIIEKLGALTGLGNSSDAERKDLSNDRDSNGQPEVVERTPLLDLLLPPAKREDEDK